MSSTDLFASLLQDKDKARVVRIEFDGGTPCNIPRLGYGKGYGSYQIQNCSTGELMPIVRIQFGVPMSANVAEIYTLIRAIEDAEKMFGKDIVLSIHGDSMIALNHAVHKRAASRKKREQIATSQGPFFVAVRALHKAVAGFTHVNAEWRGRERSVRVFGH